ncbi:MAG: hypothetical protein AAGC56_03900 [Pseudomonadota bacterium]
MIRLIAVVAVIIAGLAAPAVAGEADVVAIRAKETAPGVWRFAVTVRHADTGWDHYADRWEVLDPEGRVLGTRVLAHPHVDEQPFTRSLSGVVIPPTTPYVVVRAHDSVDGYGGKTKRVETKSSALTPQLDQ